MNILDKKIKNLLKNETFDVNPVYRDNLIRMTKDLVEQSQNRPKPVSRKSFWMKRAPVVLFSIIIAAYPVKAATGYVSSRLAKISEEEKNELRTMVYENNKKERSLDKEAIRYSRDFSESEQERYDALLTQYDQGIFPHGALPILEERHAASDETICYNPKDNCIYLPARNLTDEELLQMIDFYQKTDYSLRTSDATTTYRTDMERKKSQLSTNALSEEEAVASAAFYAETMYGISTDHMETKQNGNYGDYQITFLSDNTSYSVCIKADDASFKGISMEQEGFVYYQDNLKISKDAVQKKGKEAKTIAEKLSGKPSAITDACAQYKLNAEGNVPHGSIVYLFDLQNGDRLRMSYSIAEDSLWGATIETGGAVHKDLNVKKNEKRILLPVD